MNKGYGIGLLKRTKLAPDGTGDICTKLDAMTGCCGVAVCKEENKFWL